MNFRHKFKVALAATGRLDKETGKQVYLKELERESRHVYTVDARSN